MAVIYGDHTKHVDTLCGQSVDLVLLREGKGGGLTTALEGVRGQRHTLAALYPRQ